MFYIVLCFLSACALGVELISLGSTVSLDSVPYYIPSTPYSKVPNFQSYILAGKGGGYDAIVPVTVVKATSAAFTLAQLQQTIVTYGKEDDVWQPGFLSGKHNGSFGEAERCYLANSVFFLVKRAELVSHLHPI